ncbi:MAG TPA: protease complex subunit PrcB family protein [Phycisphaerae bacterium]|nr:protease complex subunit PrcB family protein [Phycisphaerae bacterium]
MAPGTDLYTIADGEQLPVLRERIGTFSAINRPLRLVIHDPGTLAMVPFDIGPVDFDTEMVLLASMGATPSDGYSIRIRRIWRDGQWLRARVERRFPPPDALRRGKPASPYHAVVVRRCDLRVGGFTATVSADAFGQRPR